MVGIVTADIATRTRLPGWGHTTMAERRRARAVTAARHAASCWRSSRSTASSGCARAPRVRARVRRLRRSRTPTCRRSACGAGQPRELAADVWAFPLLSRLPARRRRLRAAGVYDARSGRPSCAGRTPAVGRCRAPPEIRGTAAADAARTRWAARSHRRRRARPAPELPDVRTAPPLAALLRERLHRRARAHQVAVAVRLVDAAHRRPVLAVQDAAHRVHGLLARVGVRPTRRR